MVPSVTVRPSNKTNASSAIPARAKSKMRVRYLLLQGRQCRLPKTIL